MDMADLTTKQLAERFDVHITTVRLWLRNGLFPTAREQETPRGPVWLISEEDLLNFTTPPMGRPKKEKPAKIEEKQSTEPAPNAIKKSRNKKSSS